MKDLVTTASLLCQAQHVTDGRTRFAVAGDIGRAIDELVKHQIVRTVLGEGAIERAINELRHEVIVRCVPRNPADIDPVNDALKGVTDALRTVQDALMERISITHREVDHGQG